jgi:hypothetical protein
MAKESLEGFIRRNSHYGIGSVGSEYWSTRDLDIRDIAKLVRKACAHELGDDLIVSVRISRYSGGQSINVTGRRRKGSDRDRVMLEHQMRCIADRYNYDFSNPMYDYFSKRFFVRAQVAK